MPCYAFTFVERGSEESQQTFIKIYRDLIIGENQASNEILKILASGIHELLAIIPFENGTLSELKDILKSLFNSHI